ncbi:MAG: hypothetical protein ACRERZ_00465 [Gammaproteobacteria bacterium]
MDQLRPKQLQLFERGGARRNLHDRRTQPGGRTVHRHRGDRGELGPAAASTAESGSLLGLLAQLSGVALALWPTETANDDYMNLNHYTGTEGHIGIEARKEIISKYGATGNIYFTPDTYTTSSQAASALKITPPAGFYMVPLQNVEPISWCGEVPGGSGQECVVNHPVRLKGAIWVPVPP